MGCLQIFAGSKAWKVTVDHAQTCIIDDKKIYLYGASSNFNFVVAFDAVAQLRGIVRDTPIMFNLIIYLMLRRSSFVI